MKSRSYLLIAVALLALLATATTPAGASENVFDVVPSDSLGIMIVNRLSTTESKISDLCDNLRYPVPEQYKQVTEMLKGDTGIDRNGTLAFVAMPGEGKMSMQNGVVLVPVADLQKFLANFNVENPGDKILKAECKKTQTKVVMSPKGGYAIIAAEGAEDTLKAVLDSSQSVAASIKPWQAWLQSCDTAAIITGSGLMQFFNQSIDQLEEARQVISQGGKQMKPFETVIDAAIKQLGSGEKEIRAAAIGAVLQNDGGVELYHNVLFEPYGEMSEFFAKAPSNRENPMAGLPKGPFVMAISGAIPEELANMFGEFAAETLKASPASFGLDKKQADSLADATEDMLEGIKGFSMMIGIPAAGDPISTGTHSALWVEDSQKFLTEYGEEIREAIKEANGKSAAKMSVRDVKVSGVNTLEITVDLSAMLSEDPSDKQSQAIKAFYGPTGIMTGHVAAADANTVVFSYDGEKTLTAAINAVKNINDSLIANKGIADINRNLISGGQWVGYWSPSGTIDFINSTPGRFGLTDGPNGKLPPFPSDMPVGMAVKANAAGLVKAFYVPGEVVKAVGSYQSMFKNAWAKASQPQGDYDSDQDEPAIIIEGETYESSYDEPDDNN